MRSPLIFLLFTIPIVSQGQEMLVTRDGRNLSFDSYRLSGDGSTLNVRTCATCVTSIPVDSVAELVSFGEEKIYHLKRILRPSLKFAFLELVSSGTVTVYKRISPLREKGSGGQIPKRPSGWADYTPVEQYFVEKNGTLKIALPVTGTPPKPGLVLKEFVDDDPESLRKIDNTKFTLDRTTLLEVVDDYNARVFQQHATGDADARLSIVLVDERKVSGHSTVTVNGEAFFLNGQLLTIPIPASVDSKVCITSDNCSKCHVIRGTQHFTLFLEARVEKSGREIQFRKMPSRRFSQVAKRVSD